MRIAPLAIAFTACAASVPAAPTTPPVAGVVWNEWSADAFARADREDRLVLLSVQAGWCHWCHVMNDVTMRDPEVLSILHERFVVVRADADARPDLADRYRRYGWPATIVLTADGREVVALRGYRAPAPFRAILREAVAAAREGRVANADVSSTRIEDLEELRTRLRAQLDGFYDEEAGGWGRRQRYPVAAPIEHAFLRARIDGDVAWRQRALFTLERYAELLDPVWGGMFQYSEQGVWNRPHFEKIAAVQAGAIENFALAYRATGDRRWLEHAFAIEAYVHTFLTSPDGAFHASQDADAPSQSGAEFYAGTDAERRATEMPRVDPNVYASANGMLIEALCELAMASGRVGPLTNALAAANRVLVSHRDGATGLFRHAQDDLRMFYLADQTRMLAAFVAMHQASGDSRWIDEATRLADAMRTRLRDPSSGGLFAHTEDGNAVGALRQRRVPIDENAIAARSLLALARLRDRDVDRDSAVEIVRAIARPEELAGMGRMVGELLLAVEAVQLGHVLLSVVGPDDTRTTELHRAALANDEPTRLVELARPGASRYEYPGEPAIYLCSSEACSMPITDRQELPGALRDFLGR